MVFIKGQQSWNKNRKMNDYPQCGFQKKHKIKSSGSTGKRWSLSEKAKINHSKAMKGNKKLISSMKRLWINKEYRDNIINKISGENHYLAGKSLSKKIRKKISKSLRGKNHPNYGKHRASKTINKIKIARRKQVLPTKDTSIEIKLQKILIKNNIKYRKHESILGQPDIFIKPNICIFADGDYWHNRPEAKERDRFVNRELKKTRLSCIKILGA